KLSPAHTLTTLVTSGELLGVLGWYEPLTQFAGAGASVPITSFGNSLVKGALQEADDHGLIGVITGIFEVIREGISADIMFVLFVILIFEVINVVMCSCYFRCYILSILFKLKGYAYLNECKK